MLKFMGESLKSIYVLVNILGQKIRWNQRQSRKDRLVLSIVSGSLLLVCTIFIPYVFAVRFTLPFKEGIKTLYSQSFLVQ